MSARIRFETIDESFACSNGGFIIMFSGIFGIYSDTNRLPASWNDLRTKMGYYLHDYWPGRFHGTDRAEFYLVLEDIPVSERAELLRAAEAMLRDFLDGKVDPVFGLDERARRGNVRWLQEFVPLMKQDLATAGLKPRSEKKKRALIYFETIDKVWDYSSGVFGLMFSAAFGIYSDKARMPEIWKDLREKIGDYLHEYWPGKFPDARGVRSYHFVFDDFRRPEQLELLRACAAMLDDLVEHTVDPIFEMDADARSWIVLALLQFTELAGQDLAAADSK